MGPLVALAIALVFGTWGGTASPLLPDTIVITLVLGAGLLIVAARLGWFGHGVAGTAVACAGLALAGAGRGAWADAAAWTPPSIDVATLEQQIADGALVRVGGVLQRDAAPSSGGGVTLDLRVLRVRSGTGDVPTSFGARIHVAGDAARGRLHDWTRGRWIETPVSSLRRPLPYRNFGMPDAERTRARQGVRMAGTSKSASLVDVWPATWWDERAADARRRIRALVTRHVRDPVSAGIVTAILIGDRTAIAPEVTTRLQHAGVYHVVAISGGNVALWLLVLLIVPRLTTWSRRMHVAWLLAGLMAFALIVDGGASVARAVAVAVVVVLARWWDLRVRGAQALAAAALWLVVTDPLAVHDVGALLSFGAAITLAWAAAVRRQRGHRHVSRASPPMARRWRAGLAWCAAPVVLTAAIEIALLPIGASWFGIATAAGLLANLLAMPAMVVVQVAGLSLVAVATLWPGSGDPIGRVAAMAVDLLVRSGDVVQLAPWLVRDVPPPSAITMVVAYVSMVGLAWVMAQGPRAVRHPSPRASPTRGRTRVSRWRLASVVGCGGLLAGSLAVMVHGGVEGSQPEPWTWPGAEAWQRTSWPRDRWLVVTHLDVGQGDATVIRLPSGRTWLVDAGGSTADTFDVGERVTSRALWALGHRLLDRVVLTHGHPDHAAGMPAVMRRLRARELVLGTPVEGDVNERAVRETAAAQGVPVRSVAAGEWFADGDVRIDVLHPERPLWERRRVRNDDSVALWIRMGDVGVLLPGDVGGEVERAWLPHLSSPRLVVLKLAHHGSASSSPAALLEGLDPVIAIASAGRGNRFGHPSAAVRQRLADAGIPLFRTDEDGAIQFATNGRVLLVRSATGRYASAGLSVRGEVVRVPEDHVSP